MKNTKNSTATAKVAKTKAPKAGEMMNDPSWREAKEAAKKVVVDTIHAGGGIFVDIIDTPSAEKPPSVEKMIAQAKSGKRAAAAQKALVTKAAKPISAAKAKRAVHAVVAKIVKEAKAAELAIHVNSTGRVVFGKLAAERLGKAKFVEIVQKGSKVLMLASTRNGDTMLPIRYSHDRPYISATKQLKEVGLFDGAALDLNVSAHEENSFSVSA